jgi:hypothetical protein
MSKKNYRTFIEANVTHCDLSYRGGTLKVNVSDLFPNIDDATMGAYQNYLGGGMAGAIVGASMFDPSELKTKKDQKTFSELKEAIKQYFYDLNHGGGDDYMVNEVNNYSQNQSLPISAY